MTDRKSLLYNVVDELETELVGISDYIFNNPELAFEEFKASAALKGFFRKHGFIVKEDIAGMKTAFTARFPLKAGGPKIGLLCEYDALKSLGHACGHNVQGPAAAGAAVAISRVLKDAAGEVIVYGTPAEEEGSGKVLMARQGVFDELDASLMMHTGDRTSYDTVMLAINLVEFVFKGQAAHAAVGPEKGRSALDAVIQLFNGMEYLREHVPSDVRIHGIIKEGGVVPNIVPERAVAQFYVRADSRRKLDEIIPRVFKVAQGAALMTETEVEIIDKKSYDNLLSIQSLNDVLMKNIMELKLDNVMPPRKNTGSTDYGNVTQIRPGACLRVAVVPEDVSSHSVQYREAVGGTPGHRAVIEGAKILAGSVYDLMTDVNLLAEVKKEFLNKTKK